jgi:hypothetical protein
MTELPPAFTDLTPEEIAALTPMVERVAASPIIVVDDTVDGGQIRCSHPQNIVGLSILLEELGVPDMAFLDTFIAQLVAAASGPGATKSDVANFMLAVVKDARPRDATEAMLAAQMAAVHVATMRLAGQLAGAQMLPHQEAGARGLNTLARTYAAQMDTLKRYRSKGEQKVTVQHVTVKDGGQAVVGTVGGEGRR